MKIARFRVDNSESYGAVEGDRIRVIDGDIFGEHTLTQTTHPLASVKLLAPTKPTAFWAIGLNYAAHNEFQANALDGERIRREAQEFRPWQKGNSCIIAHNEAIVIPPESDFVHYEGELVIVIGKPARRVKREEAADYIFGYTCGNDVSNEGVFQKDSTHYRRKNCDTFGPVGPWIETELDPHNLDIITRLNGTERDRGSTSGMVWDCYETLSRLTQLITLQPGDLIITGAPGGVEAIHPGDVIEIEIPEIGALSNPVIAE